MANRGRHHAEPAKARLPMKTSRIVYLCIAAVYFLVVCGATAYCLTAYHEQLPSVDLIQADRGKVPSACLIEAADGGMLMNTVERQDGPWGKRYIVKQMTVYAYQEIDEETTFVYEAVSNENPIVIYSTAEYLYDGMEVRIS